MAVKTFTVGKVNYEGNQVGEHPNATLAVNIDTSDRTRIGDTWRRMGALGKNWTLSMTCKYDPDDTAQAAMRTEFISGTGLIGSVRMYEDTTHYFLGTSGIITGFNVTKSVGSDDELSVTIEGSGQLTYS